MAQKVRYEIEFPINSSPQLLYQYISTPSGLQEWFANTVNSRGEFFTFHWDDTEENARLASKKTGEKVRFKWVDEKIPNIILNCASLKMKLQKMSP